MMKMVMKFDKSQVPAKTIHENSAAKFDRDLHMMAGYKFMEVMLVGAAGGYSGDARATGNTSSISYGSGPGGGGLIRLGLDLKDLPDGFKADIVAGAPGADGANNTTAQGKGGDGGIGGLSSFDTGSKTYIAYGGYGATGAKWYVDGSNHKSLSTVGAGGLGGVNNAVPEGEPNGGRGVSSDPYVQYNGTVHSEDTSIDAENGTVQRRFPGNPDYDPNVWFSANGGGGGGGRCRIVTEECNPAKPGGWGSYEEFDDPEGFGGIAEVSSPGEFPTGNRGGAGGGANLVDLYGDGIDLNYGSKAPGHNPNGAVAIKLS